MAKGKQVKSARMGTLNKGRKLGNQASPRMKPNVPNLLRDFKPTKKY